MKILIFITLLVFSIYTQAQITNPDYDSTLVKKLNGDERGMKMYVFVLLKTGSNKTTDKEFINTAFTGHMKNMGVLVKENKLIVAGPFEKNEEDFRGLFILDVNSLEEAKVLLETDPAIKAELLKPEMFLWYGSAALPMYLQFADKLKKNKN